MMPNNIKFFAGLRFCVAAAAFAVSWFVWGCEGKIEYYPVYKEVKIPVPCEVTPPDKPLFIGDPVKDNINILHYTEMLQAALSACTNGGVK